MKLGERTTLRIAKMDKKGRGCGTVNGRNACVSFAAPGEEMEATLLRRDKGAFILKAERVVAPAPSRIEPQCSYAGKCGGCAWQQFDYASQLGWKRDLVNDTFSSAGIDMRIEAVIPAASQFYYRNRMDYCVGPRGEIGLKEPGRWNAFLDLSTCYLLSPDAVKAMEEVRAWMKANAVAPWDNVHYKGYLRYVVIREGKRTGQRLIMLVTSDSPLPAEDELCRRLAPYATGIVHGINPTITDVSVPARIEPLTGSPHIEEEVGGKRFIIPPGSFFQTNTEMAEQLVGKIREFLSVSQPHDIVTPQPLRLSTSPSLRHASLLDLYCGVGFLGISLADMFSEVTGIELDERAVEVAAKNAAANGVTNATFAAYPAENLSWADYAPDVVIVDPPRSGLHPKVARLLAEKTPPTIVYVSCNYESFARDWQVLRSRYAIEKVAALDLFPHSPHVELVALLDRKP